jgi:hypothetical protein
MLVSHSLIFVEGSSDTGCSYSRRTEVYALGCLMFEILTGGQVPWMLEMQADPQLNEHDAFIDMLLRTPAPQPTLLGERACYRAHTVARDRPYHEGRVTIAQVISPEKRQWSTWS